MKDSISCTTVPGAREYDPALSFDDGVAWMASIAFSPTSGGRHVILRDNSAPSGVIVYAGSEHILPPACAAASGTVWVLWIGCPDFRVVARPWDPRRQELGPLMFLSPPGERCHNLCLSSTGDALCAAWEVWASDASNGVSVRRWTNEAGWSTAVSLTSATGRASWPSVVESNGRLWFTWSEPNEARDGYRIVVGERPTDASPADDGRQYQLSDRRHGNFNLYPRLMRNVDGSVWVTWSTTTDEEYYESTGLPGSSAFAYVQDEATRRKRNAWWKTSYPVVEWLRVDDGRIVAHGPRPGADDGSVRSAGLCSHPVLAPALGVPTLLARRTTKQLLFETLRFHWGPEGWGAPESITLPTLQTGRNGPVAVAFDTLTTRSWCALQLHETEPGDSFRWIPPRDGGVAVVPVMQSSCSHTATGISWSSRTLEVVDRQRPDRVTQSVNAPKRPPYFGNTHVHSEFSGCRRATQGSADFNYRWGMDLMGHDFMMLTDHAEHMSEYDWAWTEAMAAFYDFPGHHTTLLAYEWTVNNFGTDPHSGHCNVFLRASSGRAHGSDDPETATLEGLWSRLEPDGALTVPHHTASFPYLRDWRLHDPRFERLIEVQQDRRGNYEYRGCPGEYGASAPLQAMERNVDGGYVVDALARGYRLGFCAGGDHMGVSMTGVMAPSLTRDELFQALRDRRCFGVTGAKIDIAVAVEQAGCTIGTAGDEVTLAAGPFIVRVSVKGTEALRSVDLISGGTVLATQEGSGAFLDHGFELAYPPVYLYVRVVQADGHMAWSSPIWTATG